MTSKPANLQSLFASAQSGGEMDKTAAQVLLAPDLGARIQAGLSGLDPDSIPSSEVVLVSLLIDDSGSIRFGANADAVRGGHNEVISALSDSKQKNDILFHTRYLNGIVLYPVGPLSGAIRLDSSNYDPKGGTPLYDETVVMLGTVRAAAQQFTDNGVVCRTVTLIVTDGHDEGSRKQTAATVSQVVTDMHKRETHIVMGMGINDGMTDFRQVFGEMGIPGNQVLVPGKNPKEIRRAFNTFSQSAVRASQGATGFSKVAATGFASP